MGDKEGRTAPEENVLHFSSLEGSKEARNSTPIIRVGFATPEHLGIGNDVNLPSSKPNKKPNEHGITGGSVASTKNTNEHEENMRHGKDFVDALNKDETDAAKRMSPEHEEVGNESEKVD
ncbi:uncharacterized protein LOC114526171 [Dendronephthya gigantea]|uniref:uncharacterized protein LOC114526171 n=1 Tax=Dendronephthya gigantea TaxID=151771 RepID=UPI00106A8EE9|nr:uncharacterized protein LOC114526171 [Dendronephthya gigantea]